MQYSLAAATIHHIWLPLRLSLISCSLERPLCMINGVLPNLSARSCSLPRLSAGRNSWTVSAGSHFSQTVVSARSKRSQTVSAEAKYDGQSQQEAKIGRLVLHPVNIQMAFFHRYSSLQHISNIKLEMFFREKLMSPHLPIPIPTFLP